MKPLVSIICITYNQKEYITQTIDGFLEQKIDFPFEILVHDDASTDGTTEILKKYADSHPGVFRLFLEKENQYSKRNFKFIKDMYVASKGKYIAICEGDDFWTDPTKLQLQVDFLENHADYAVVFHPVRVFFENGEHDDSIFPDMKSGFTLKRLLQSNFIQTNSVVYRAHSDYSDMVYDVLPGDWYTHLYHAQFGEIGFIDRVMSAYRRHEEGVWWSSMDEDRSEFWTKYRDGYMTFHAQLLKMYDSPEYSEVIARNIEGSYKSIIQTNAVTSNKNMLYGIISKYPHVISAMVDLLIDDTVRLNEDIKKEHIAMNEQKDALLDRVRELENSLQSIRSSKTWRLRTKLVRFIRR